MLLCAGSNSYFAGSCTKLVVLLYRRRERVVIGRLAVVVSSYQTWCERRRHCCECLVLLQTTTGLLTPTCWCTTSRLRLVSAFCALFAALYFGARIYVCSERDCCAGAADAMGRSCSWRCVLPGLGIADVLFRCWAPYLSPVCSATCDVACVQVHGYLNPTYHSKWVLLTLFALWRSSHES